MNHTCILSFIVSQLDVLLMLYSIAYHTLHASPIVGSDAKNPLCTFQRLKDDGKHNLNRWLVDKLAYIMIARFIAELRHRRITMGNPIPQINNGLHAIINLVLVNTPANLREHFLLIP